VLFDLDNGLIIRIPTLLALLHEPDRTGRSVFTVNFGIPAGKAILAEVDIVLHTQEIGIDFRVARARTHPIHLPFE
jgi:hypothetical protein